MKHVGLFFPYCDVDVNYGVSPISKQQKSSHSLSSLETEDARDAYASIAVNPSTTLASKCIHSDIIVVVIVVSIVTKSAMHLEIAFLLF